MKGVTGAYMIKKYLKERLGLIIFLAVAIVLVIWGAISISIARKNAITFEDEYIPAEGNVDFSDAGSYKTAAENETMELLYNEAKGTIQLKDKKSGYIWKSVVDKELYDLDNMNQQWSAYLQSILTISYNDMEKRDAPPVKMYSAKDCNDLSVEYLENGVAVTYGFTTPGIFLTVEYVLEDGEFVVRIPHEKIQEITKYAITSMEILPYFGAAGNDVDGYLFYPDGSGAITRYDNAANRPASVKAGMWRTYSDKSMNYENLVFYENANRYAAALPVYGIKNDDNALLAAFTKGAENSGVVAYPSGYVVDLNHIGFEIYTRNVFDVNMFNVSSGIGETSTGKMIQRVDRELIKEDREIRFFLLHGEKANYSGMASTYREYLMKKDLLVGVIQDGDMLPLSLEFLMGVTKEGMIFDEYIKMTSFDDLIEIFDRLKAQGITNTETVLSAWLKDNAGYPAYWPAAGQIGGKSGLKALNNYIKENSGNHVYLQNDFFLASSKNGGFSEVDDVVYNGLNQTVTGGFETTLYLLNPQVSFNRSNKFLDKIKSLPNIGVAYEDLGRVVYPDYNENNVFTKGQTAEKWREILANTQEREHRTAVDGMNQYTFTNADYLYHTREESFGLFITDSAVPFVQMVLSGLIPYSTERAGNLSYDLEIQKLKWIEYGALPSFVLTYEDAIHLKETGYDSIFTSTYDVWEERVVDVYREFQENFQHVYGLQMTEHEVLEEGLIRIGYEDGTIIYLNYNKADRIADGRTIPQKGYLIVGGGVQG